MDPRQRQRLGWIVRFFALLLVLTLLARGTAGAAMASVTVQRPSSGNVTKSVRTTATVSFAGGTPFTVPAGLLVMAVPVQAGQTVKAGDIIEVTFGNRPIKVKVLSDVEPRTKDVAREMYEILSE